MMVGPAETWSRKSSFCGFARFGMGAVDCGSAFGRKAVFFTPLSTATSVVSR